MRKCIAFFSGGMVSGHSPFPLIKVITSISPLTYVLFEVLPENFRELLKNCNVECVKTPELIQIQRTVVKIKSWRQLLTLRSFIKKYSSPRTRDTKAKWQLVCTFTKENKAKPQSLSKSMKLHNMQDIPILTATHHLLYRDLLQKRKQTKTWNLTAYS